MIAITMIVVFLGLLVFINRRQLGVRNFDDYATASRSIGTLGITFGVLATWYVGATFTAWAGFAVDFGFIAYYVTPYALITMVVLYLVGERTFVWGKKHRIETQAELLGMRYGSNALRLIIGFAGVALSVPWLLMEWWTQGFVVSYASGGTIAPFWGMLVGVVVVVTYVALGGMRSVITANILQGVYMFFFGTALLVWFVYTQFGGFGALFNLLTTEFPETLTYPGPGWEPPPAYWTSLVITSGLGGFMWPWVYNKLLAADSVRTIKRTVLLAPILGTVFYGVFVIVGMGLHTVPWGREDSQVAFLELGTRSGPVALGLLGVLITAASVSTVSGILNAMSTAITNDMAIVINRQISRQTAVRIARVSVVILGLIALAGAAVQQGLLIFLALLTYQGMIMLFPVVILGLYWRRANKEGALLGFLAGTSTAFFLTITNPDFLTTYGWTSGMYGFLVTVVIMVVAGFMKKEEPHIAELWNEVDEARTRVGVGNVSGGGPAPVTARALDKLRSSRMVFRRMVSALLSGSSR